MPTSDRFSEGKMHYLHGDNCVQAVSHSIWQTQEAGHGNSLNAKLHALAQHFISVLSSPVAQVTNSIPIPHPVSPGNHRYS